MQAESTHIRSARDSLKNQFGLAQYNFLHLISELINNVIQVSEAEIQSMKKELVLIENGRLHIDRNHNHVYFRCCPIGSSSTVNISSDDERVHLLARRSFLENRLAATELFIRKLNNVQHAHDLNNLEEMMQKKLNKYVDVNLDLSRIIFTKEQNEWINQPYSPNPFYPESLHHKTKGGILVRSKSEAKLGSVLEMVGLPYRTDDFVAIRSSQFGAPDDVSASRPHRDSYFADFKVPNLLGGITIHEHLGAFHKDQYGDNSLRRLNDYHNFTLIEIPDRPVAKAEITWSFEDDLMDDTSIKRLLARMLLPGLLG